MADKAAVLKLTCFLLKTLDIRQNLPNDTNIVYRYVLLVYSIIFAEQPLFKNFILLQSEDRDVILSLNWVWKTVVILTIECSIYRNCTTILTNV